METCSPAPSLEREGLSEFDKYFTEALAKRLGDSDTNTSDAPLLLTTRRLQGCQDIEDMATGEETQQLHNAQARLAQRRKHLERQDHSQRGYQARLVRLVEEKKRQVESRTPLQLDPHWTALSRELTTLNRQIERAHRKVARQRRRLEHFGWAKRLLEHTLTTGRAQVDDARRATHLTSTQSLVSRVRQLRDAEQNLCEQTRTCERRIGREQAQLSQAMHDSNLRRETLHSKVEALLGTAERVRRDRESLERDWNVAAACASQAQILLGQIRASSLSMYRIVSRVRPAHDSLFSTDPLQVMHTTCAQLDHIAHFITDHTGHPDARS